MAATTAEVDRPRILYSDDGPEPPYPLRMEGAVISGFGRGSKELGIPTANLPVDTAAAPWIESAKSGVYFGYASLALPSSHPDYQHHQHQQQRSHLSNPRAAVDAPPAPIASPSSSSSPSTGTADTTTTKEASEAVAAGEAEQEQETKQQWQIYPMVMSIGYNPFYKNAVRSAEVHVLHAFGADFYGAPMRLLILGFVRDERDYASLDALVTDINVDCDVARQSLARPAWTPREGTATAGSSGSGSTSSGTFDGAWLVREES